MWYIQSSTAALVHNRLKTISHFVESVIAGYGVILFCNKKLPSYIFLFATFINPSAGLMGLAGGIFATVTAHILAYPKEDIRNGIYGFNGILLAIALVYFHGVASETLLFLPIGAFLSTLLTGSISNIFHRTVSLPSMSLPFVISTWLIEGALIHYGYGLPKISSWNDVPPSFHDVILGFFRSIGFIFFSPNPVSGVIVFIGIVLFTRYAAFLCVLGYGISAIIYLISEGNVLPAVNGYGAFNAILTILSIGGFLLIPTSSSVILAVSGGILTILTQQALTVFLAQYNLPFLAAPFNIVSLLILSGIALSKESRFQCPVPPLGSPEENLFRFLDREKKEGISIPFIGWWTVTQGVMGDKTHKGEWGWAWDFEVRDEHGKPNRGDAENLEDFYTYGLPVLAPITGYVINLRDNQPDNPPGHTNTAENWGNFLLLEGTNGHERILLSHLKQNSIMVKIGDSVREGQRVALAGNSGLSSIPHIHIQRQTSFEPGGTTLPVFFTHYIIKDKNEDVYIPYGVPKEGEKVRRLEVDKELKECFQFTMGDKWQFIVTKGTKRFKEEWAIEMDLSGRIIIKSSQYSGILPFSISGSFCRFYHYEGIKNTALWAFASSVKNMPFYFAQNLKWTEDIASPWWIFNKSTVSHKLQKGKNISPSPFILTTEVFSRYFSGNQKKRLEITIHFLPYKGPLKIVASHKGRIHLMAERII